MDIEMLKNQIDGLEARLKVLRASRDLFIRANGMEEEEERARQEMGTHEVNLQATKEKIADLQSRKSEALKPTMEGLKLKMGAVLPEGEAVFEINDGNVFIGWQRPGRESVPYAGLSGGQKAIFDKALEYALAGKGEKVLIVEAAELDGENLVESMARLAALPEDTQIIVLSCHKPQIIPASWAVVETT